MPLFVNDAVRYRNPDFLLIACGMPWRPGKQDEACLLRKLNELPPSKLKHLFLVTGGFRDGKEGFCQRILDDLPDDIREKCDLFYREHDEYGDITKIILPYARSGKKVILAGHSWGAASLVHKVLADAPFSVNLLLTLDPVSRTPAPASLPQAQRWVNVYIDYHRAPWLSVSNMLARLGKPWSAVDAAQRNIMYRKARHAGAGGMFQETLEEVRLLLV